MVQILNIMVPILNIMVPMVQILHQWVHERLAQLEKMPDQIEENEGPSCMRI